MKRFLTLLAVLLVAPLAAHAADSQKPAAEPNILLITDDDMNQDSAGCYGGVAGSGRIMEQVWRPEDLIDWLFARRKGQ